MKENRKFCLLDQNTGFIELGRARTNVRKKRSKKFADGEIVFKA